MNRYKIAILTAHGVLDDDRKYNWKTLRSYLSTHDLEYTIKLLKDEGYNFISLEDAVAILKGEAERRPYCVVATFDDGYRNNMVNALPILEKYDVPMTIFIATENIESSEPFWFDKLDYLMQQHNGDSLELDFLDTKLKFNTQNRRERRFSFKKLVQFRNNYNDNDENLVAKTTDLIEKLEEKYKAKLDKGDIVNSVLSWEEVSGLIKRGVYFGSHTCGHMQLDKLNEKQLENELSLSRDNIEKQLGMECKYICYPYGNYNKKVMEQTRNCGYEAGLTSDEGLNDASTDLMGLKRLNIPSDSNKSSILALICGMSCTVHKIRMRFSGRQA